MSALPAPCMRAPIAPALPSASVTFGAAPDTQSAALLTPLANRAISGWPAARAMPLTALATGRANCATLRTTGAENSATLRMAPPTPPSARPAKERALSGAAPLARVLAAIVPAINATRLLLVGSGVVSDPGLVNSVSRSGDRGELLKGPLYYVIVLVAATVLCWRDNPAGLIAIAMMCGGDGLADIVGRRWGTAKLPYNPAKSWAGSVAMLLGGYGMSYGLITLFCSLGFFACYPLSAMTASLGAVAAAATIVESLPINQYLDDNVSVPGVAVAASLLLLPAPSEAAALAAQQAAQQAAAAVGVLL